MGMSDPIVYIVHLRRPRKADPNEARSDPYFEFGSFGCTGCHSGNLMNPARPERLHGARLAFAQGGPLGFRLVHLTPPVTVRRWSDRLEARWEPAEMPFRYGSAPVLAANGAASDFPLVERLARSAARDTVEGGFSSRFRTRAQPLASTAARELIAVYTKLRAAAVVGVLAVRYEQAMPYPPRLVDLRRSETYKMRVASLESAVAKWAAPADACRRRD